MIGVLAASLFLALSYGVSAQTYPGSAFTVYTDIRVYDQAIGFIAFNLSVTVTETKELAVNYLACLNSCEADPNCDSFTYDATPVAPETCYLYQGDVRREANAGTDAYHTLLIRESVVAMECHPAGFDVLLNYAGLSDLGQTSLTVSTEEACVANCKADTFCTAVEWDFLNGCRKYDTSNDGHVRYESESRYYVKKPETDECSALQCGFRPHVRPSAGTGGTTMAVYANDFLGCWNGCLTTVTCEGFDWVDGTGTCIFHDATSVTSVVETTSAIYHHRSTCDCDFQKTGLYAVSTEVCYDVTLDYGFRCGGWTNELLGTDGFGTCLDYCRSQSSCITGFFDSRAVTESAFKGIRCFTSSTTCASPVFASGDKRTLYTMSVSTASITSTTVDDVNFQCRNKVVYADTSSPFSLDGGSSEWDLAFEKITGLASIDDCETECLQSSFCYGYDWDGASTCYLYEINRSCLLYANTGWTKVTLNYC